MRLSVVDKIFRGREGGVSLIETAVALVIFSIIGAIVLSSLQVSAISTRIGSEQTTAESLARSQLDYVQNQSYDSVNNPPVYSVLSSLPTGYSIVTPMATRLDPKGDGTGNDDGLQKITVTVQHNTRTVYTLENYKVQR